MVRWSSSAVFVVLFTGLSVASVELRAQEDRGFAPGYVIEQQELPYVFYHWTRYESLNRPYKLEAIRNGAFPIPWLLPNFLLTQRLPGLSAHKEGLFAWIDPISGMGSNEAEIYGESESVIAFSLKKRPLRVLTVNTTGPLPNDIDFSQIDVIHHRFVEPVDGSESPAYKVTIEEFVVLRSDAVDQFTADPEVIKPLIAKRYREIRAGRKFAEDELHLKNDHPVKSMFTDAVRFNAAVMPRIEKYLASDRQKIAAEWRRPWPGFMAAADQDREAYKRASPFGFVRRGCSLVLRLFRRLSGGL